MRYTRCHSDHNISPHYVSFHSPKSPLASYGVMVLVVAVITVSMILLENVDFMYVRAIEDFIFLLLLGFPMMHEDVTTAFGYTRA